MFKLAKYLKPYRLALAAAIALLFAQALSDLYLPNLMSDIVTVGITQQGITRPAPPAMSQRGFQLMSALMTDEQRDVMGKAYTLTGLSQADEDGKPYADTYPRGEEKLYILGVLSPEDTEQLDRVFSEAAGTLIALLRALPESTGQTADSVDTAALDPTLLYESILPYLDVLPYVNPQALPRAQEQAIQTDPALLTSMSIALHRAFSEELGVDINALQNRSIIRIGILMLAVALLGGSSAVLLGLLSSRVAAGFSRDVRKAVFTKIESFSQAEFDQFSTASLITRSTNDVTQLQMLLIMGVRFILFAPIMGVGGVIMALRKSVSMGWIIGLACIVLLGIFCLVLAVALPKFTIVQSLVDRLNLVSRENLSGLMVIRAFGARAHEQQRFEKANRDLTRTNLFINRIMVMMWPVMMLLMNGISILIIWVGGHHIAESGMPIGDMMAYMQYAAHVIMSFLIISMMFVFVPRSAVSGKRIAEVLRCTVSVKDPESPVAFDPAQKGVVTFQNVCFRYHGAQEDALKDISFTARPGQTTAIIGSTGSGKTTVAQLLLRFYDVTDGQVCVEGADVRKVRQSDLRDRIGYVPQRGALLSGTIASNIAYGQENMTEQELERAADVAQALDFIQEKEGGFAAEIAQGGANVSGGQKQRLSIARALAKKPGIFVFDDSFSALDFKTDAALRRALAQHTGDSTVICITQRVATAMTADHILVLNDGRLVGQGKHDRLMQDCTEYAEIASSQLSEQELAHATGKEGLV